MHDDDEELSENFLTWVVTNKHTCSHLLAACCSAPPSHKETPSAPLCVAGSLDAVPQVFSSWHSLLRSPGLSSGFLLGTHLTVQRCRENRGFQEKMVTFAIIIIIVNS